MKKNIRLLAIIPVIFTVGVAFAEPLPETVRRHEQMIKDVRTDLDKLKKRTPGDSGPQAPSRKKNVFFVVAPASLEGCRIRDGKLTLDGEAGPLASRKVETIADEIVVDVWVDLRCQPLLDFQCRNSSLLDRSQSLKYQIVLTRAAKTSCQLDFVTFSTPGDAH